MFLFDIWQNENKTMQLVAEIKIWTQLFCNGEWYNSLIFFYATFSVFLFHF